MTRERPHLLHVWGANREAQGRDRFTADFVNKQQYGRSPAQVLLNAVEQHHFHRTGRQPLLQFQRGGPDGTMVSPGWHANRLEKEALHELGELLCSSYSAYGIDQKRNIQSIADIVVPKLRPHATHLNALARDCLWPLFWDVMVNGSSATVFPYNSKNAADAVRTFRDAHGLSKNGWKSLVNAPAPQLFVQFIMDAHFSIEIVPLPHDVVDHHFNLSAHTSGRQTLHTWLRRNNITNITAYEYHELCRLLDDFVSGYEEMSRQTVLGVISDTANTPQQLGRVIRDMEAIAPPPLSIRPGGVVWVDETHNFSHELWSDIARQSFDRNVLSMLSAATTPLEPHRLQHLSTTIGNALTESNRNLLEWRQSMNTLRPIELTEEHRRILDEARRHMDGQINISRIFHHQREQDVITITSSADHTERRAFTLEAVEIMRNAFHESHAAQRSSAWAALREYLGMAPNIGPEINDEQIKCLRRFPAEIKFTAPGATLVTAKLLHSTKAIKDEGEKMLHCLGRSYMSRILKGQYVAYHMDVSFTDITLFYGINGHYNSGQQLRESLQQHGVTIGFNLVEDQINFDQMHGYRNENVPHRAAFEIQRTFIRWLEELTSNGLTKQTATDKITAEKEKHYAAMAISNA